MKRRPTADEMDRDLAEIEMMYVRGNTFGGIMEGLNSRPDVGYCYRISAVRALVDQVKKNWRRDVDLKVERQIGLLDDMDKTAMRIVGSGVCTTEPQVADLMAIAIHAALLRSRLLGARA